MLSFYLATHHARVIHKAVPISGMLLPSQYPKDACKQGDELAPIAAVHGTADKAIPIEGADAAVKAIADLGCKATIERIEGVAHAAPPELRAAVEKALAAALP
jgi:predicted esterase